MKALKLVVTVLLGALLVMGGIAHFMNPAMSSGFIPDFLPKNVVHIAIGIIEMTLGIGMFIPRFRTQAAWGIYILMICFLPLHLMDLFRDAPVIGSRNAAMIRVPIQFLLIWMAWFASRQSKLTIADFKPM